jgi:arylformamidase
LYLAVGGAESSEFRRQAELLGKCWRANLAEQLILPDVHHFSIVDEFARPNGPLFDATMRMLQG